MTVIYASLVVTVHGDSGVVIFSMLSGWWLDNGGKSFLWRHNSGDMFIRGCLGVRKWKFWGHCRNCNEMFGKFLANVRYNLCKFYIIFNEILFIISKKFNANIKENSRNSEKVKKNFRGNLYIFWYCRRILESCDSRVSLHMSYCSQWFFLTHFLKILEVLVDPFSSNFHLCSIFSKGVIFFFK